MNAQVFAFPSTRRHADLIAETVADVVRRGYERRTRVLRAVRIARKEWEAAGVPRAVAENDLVDLKAAIDTRLDAIEHAAAELEAEIAEALAVLDGPPRPRGPSGGGRAA